jgi:two-component system phosphate regulon response regulator PhoB
MKPAEAAKKPRVLVVDDEPDAIDLLSVNLKCAGFDVLAAADGAEALQIARRRSPDLVLLDLLLPGLHGFHVCTLLRNDPKTRMIPVVIVSALCAESDRVHGLELGADDYITKPYSPRELILRVRNLLRRRHAVANPDRIQVGELLIDLSRYCARMGNRHLELTATEFKLLTVLAQRAGLVQSRDQLLRDVWQTHAFVTTRTVDTHMRRLRRKLGRDARFLDTVRGFGYRLREA